MYLIFTHVRIIKQNESAGKEIKHASRKKLGRAVACVGYVLGGGCELVEAAARGEDDERDLGVAEDGELVRLLEQAVAALGEGHLPVYLVLNPLQLHLAATHL